MFLISILIYNTYIVFSQDNLFFSYTNKYIEMEGKRDEPIYKEDYNKFYFIKDIKNSEKVEIKEYGRVFNHRKFGLWTGVNKQNEIVCHRFYDEGYLMYDIMYYKGKIHAFANYKFNSMILDDWRDKKDIRDIKGNLQVPDIIFYTEDGQIKTQYQYYNGEYIEKKHNINEVDSVR